MMHIVLFTAYNYKNIKQKKAIRRSPYNYFLTLLNDIYAFCSSSSEISSFCLIISLKTIRAS